MKKQKIDIKEYKKLGFTVIRNIIPKKQLKEIMFSILSNTKKYSKLSKINITNDLDNLLYKLRKKNTKNFGLLYDSMQTVGNLYQVFTSERILKSVSDILSVKKNLITFTEPALRLDAPHDKRNSLGWHQDSSYCRQNIDGGNGVVLWLPVRKLTKEMGRLQFLEKSHNIGSLNIKKKKHDKYSSQQRLIPESFLELENNIIEVDLKLGDVLAMNLNLVHRSGINFSKKFRISIIGRYHNMISDDFKSGLNIYRYSDKTYNKKTYESI